MPIYALGDADPEIHETAFVHPDAVVIGRVGIGPEASVWPCAVLRGDHGRIEVGAVTSVQDGTVVHCTHEWPTLIGADCVVGHNAHLEGCVVQDGCLIGSGSVTLNRGTGRGGAIVAAAWLGPRGVGGPPGGGQEDRGAGRLRRVFGAALHRVRPGPPGRPAAPGPSVTVMIDGMAVTDAHMHVPRLSTVSSAWMRWASDFGQDSGWQSVFGPDGDPVPARLDAMLAAEGVDVALLFAEYRPRTTGIQPVEDLLPLIAYNPDRFRLVANVNPAVHPDP